MTYRLFLKAGDDGPHELLLETDDPVLVRRVVANALPKTRVIQNNGRPGLRLYAWAPEYPEGRLFATASSYAKDRGICQTNINKALAKPPIAVPGARLSGFLVPEGLKVHPIRGGFFVTEETLLKFRKQAIGE